ncbi:hypothetical protein ACP4OV_027241 [Aristida adscensionis]
MMPSMGWCCSSCRLRHGGRRMASGWSMPYRRSMPYIPNLNQGAESTDIIRSAVELYKAGIQFKASKPDSFHRTGFRRGVLILPSVRVDDSTEYTLLNMMAFERQHTDAGYYVTAYVFFMDSIVESAKDVALLSSGGIIQNAAGSYEAVANLFHSIPKDIILENNNPLFVLQRMVNGYCSKPWNRFRTNLWHSYAFSGRRGRSSPPESSSS